MAFRNPLTTISADDVTPGTLTGSTIQTAATGQRIVIEASGPNANAVTMYSGHPSEVDPGDLYASVQSGGGGVTYPSMYLTAPNAAVGKYGGFLHIRSGDFNTDTQGYWELTTGDGSGKDPVAIFGRNASDTELAQFTVDLAQWGLGSGYADHTITGDTFDWTNVHNDGFFHYSDGSTDTFEVSGYLAAGSTNWQTYTPTVGGAGTATFTTRTGWYRELGQEVEFCVNIVVNAAGSGASAVTVTAPTLINRTTRQLIPAQGDGLTAGNVGSLSALALTGATTNVINHIRNPTGGIVTGAALQAGAFLTIQGTYRKG